MHAFVSSGWFIVLLIGVLAMIFILPTVIALCRHIHGLGFVIFMNVLAGIIGISWPVALVCACIYPRQRRTTKPGRPLNRDWR